MNTLLFIILQALTADTELKGVGGGASSGSLKSLGMSIAGLGLLFAGIAVIKKLAKNEPKSMESLVGWIVALAVYIGVWNLL